MSNQAAFDAQPVGPVPHPPLPQQKKKHRWVLPTAVGFLAFLFGVGVGGASEADSTELEATQANLAAMTQERDTLKEDLDAASSSVNTQQADVEGALKSADDREAKLDEREAELEKMASALDERESAVSDEEKKVTESTFGEGRWVVGDDIKAGTYKTSEPVESTSCYWAITTSGSNGNDIIANDFATKGNHTVTLKKGQDFESQDCGSWKRQK